MTILSRIFGFLSSWFSVGIGSTVARWTAMKVLLWSIFFTVFPILVNNAIYYMMEISISLLQQAPLGDISNLDKSISIPGCAGSLLTVFRIPQAFSMIISATIFNMVMRMIPGIGRGF